MDFSYIKDYIYPHVFLLKDTRKIPYHNLSSLNEHKLLIVEEIICIKKYELEDKDQLLYKMTTLNDYRFPA